MSAIPAPVGSRCDIEAGMRGLQRWSVVCHRTRALRTAVERAAAVARGLKFLWDSAQHGHSVQLESLWEQCHSRPSAGEHAHRVFCDSLCVVGRQRNLHCFLDQVHVPRLNRAGLPLDACSGLQGLKVSGREGLCSNAVVGGHQAACAPAAVTPQPNSSNPTATGPRSRPGSATVSAHARTHTSRALGC